MTSIPNKGLEFDVSCMKFSECNLKYHFGCNDCTWKESTPFGMDAMLDKLIALRDCWYQLSKENQEDIWWECGRSIDILIEQAAGEI